MMIARGAQEGKCREKGRGGPGEAGEVCGQKQGPVK